MTGKEILQAMSHIEEELIEDAKLDSFGHSEKKKLWNSWNWVAVFVAVFICVIGVTGVEAGVGNIIFQNFLDTNGSRNQNSADWTVDYAVGAPSSSANPVVYRTLPYSSKGFYAECTAISGSNDRRVMITNTNLGGFKNESNKYITTTGTSATWKTTHVTIGAAQFKIVALGTTNCSASGTIHCKE